MVCWTSMLAGGRGMHILPSTVLFSGGTRAFVRRLALLVPALAVFLSAVPASAGSYNSEPYNNSTCSCCKMPGTVMHDLIWGTGLSAGSDSLHKYYKDDLFEQKIKVALQQAADTYRNILMTHAGMVGGFIDGKNAMTAQTALQKLNAGTVKDYLPSDQICRFGTLSRSLANSQDKSRTVQIGLMEYFQGRQLMKQNMVAGYAGRDGTTIGRSADKTARWAQLTKTFCNKSDSNQSLDGSVSSSAQQKCEAGGDTQLNFDVNSTRTLFGPETLDITFSDTTQTLTPDETGVMALGANIYAHDLPANLGKSDFSAMASNADDAQMRKLFDFRSVIAKRSVAANSFASIAAMKAKGGAESKEYLEAVAKELGLSSTEDLKEAVGDNPSYYAQMEFLTKRLYQTPLFYANLYDSPGNVERQQSAIKAISLMQDRDMYESLRRSEMLLSTWLEMKVQREQDRYFGKGIK